VTYSQLKGNPLRFRTSVTAASHLGPMICETKMKQANIASFCRRYWDHEVQKATKELRKPRLSRVIIQCYWKPYAVLGLFTLIEVRVWSVLKFDI